MKQATWTMLWQIGIVITGAVVLFDFDEIIFGLLGAVVWGLFAFGSTNIVNQVGTCCVYRNSEPGAAILGVILMAVMFATALKGELILLNPTGGDPTETENG